MTVIEENAMLKEALLDATAHLVAATSAYEKYAGNAGRRSVRDPFFTTRLADYEKAIARTRRTLKELNVHVEC